MTAPPALHHRIPLLRRPFWQRDVALAERDAARAERDAIRAELAQVAAEREAARARVAALEAERRHATRVWTMALSGSGSAAAPLAEAERIACLRQKFWYSVFLPPEAANVTGMIHSDERRLLYTLARDYFSGAGRIIDGGSYIGASAASLGAGLRGRAWPAERVIDSFDTFVILAESIETCLFEGDDAARALREGDNVRFLFERNTAPFADYIDIHEGDLMARPWSGAPIEILFCDVSKGWVMNDYILTQWFPALLPQTGILIQQDQVQEHHVWVAITMEMLSDYFEFIDYTPLSSAVWRLRQSIPAAALEACLQRNVTPAAMAHYYRRFIERFRGLAMGRHAGWNLGLVEAGLAVTYGFHIGDVDAAFAVLRDCEARYAEVPDTMRRLAAIRGHLEARTPCPGSILYR